MLIKILLQSPVCELGSLPAGHNIYVFGLVFTTDDNKRAHFIHNYPNPILYERVTSYTLVQYCNVVGVVLSVVYMRTGCLCLHYLSLQLVSAISILHCWFCDSCT